MEQKTKQFFSGLAILIGTCIGAGVLGIPYVAAKSGFAIALFYILFLGLIILFANLYLGEITLRTKEKKQLGGYAEKYLGKKGKIFMNFAFIFGIYSAIIAYTFGIGESFSFLFFGSASYSILIGLLFAFFMSFLIWKGLKGLKRFEKWGVGIIFLLLALIILFFAGRISTSNLSGLNLNYFLLPFGVVLFALLSFDTIPEINFALKDNKKQMKKVLVIGTLVSVIFYVLFTLVVVGFKGRESPEIATTALGPVFILLGIFTMFTSYLALGNALKDHFQFDSNYKKARAWFLSAIIPIFIFLFIKMFKYFSFTKILSIGGVVSGGAISVLILLMAKKAKEKGIGNRKPEYSIPINWFVIILLSLIFVLGVIREVLVVLG